MEQIHESNLSGETKKNLLKIIKKAGMFGS